MKLQFYRRFDIFETQSCSWDLWNFRV